MTEGSVLAGNRNPRPAPTNSTGSRFSSRRKAVYARRCRGGSFFFVPISPHNDVACIVDPGKSLFDYLSLSGAATYAGVPQTFRAIGEGMNDDVASLFRIAFYHRPYRAPCAASWEKDI